MADDISRARSGRPLGDPNVAGLRDGTLAPSDLAMHSETRLHQARLAETKGYGPLARNFRRTTGLTRLPDTMLAGIYGRLRRRPSSNAEPLALSQGLAALHDAPETGRFLRDAAEAYRSERLLRPEETGGEPPWHVIRRIVAVERPSSAFQCGANWAASPLTAMLCRVRRGSEWAAPALLLPDRRKRGGRPGRCRIPRVSP